MSKLGNGAMQPSPGPWPVRWMSLYRMGYWRQIYCISRVYQILLGEVHKLICTDLAMQQYSLALQDHTHCTLGRLFKRSNGAFVVCVCVYRLCGHTDHCPVSGSVHCGH